VGDPTPVAVAGMRQFVAALDPKKPAAVKWLVPKEFLRPEK
jgi:hypothetical protein